MYSCIHSLASPPSAFAGQQNMPLSGFLGLILLYGFAAGSMSSGQSSQKTQDNDYKYEGTVSVCAMRNDGRDCSVGVSAADISTFWINVHLRVPMFARSSIELLMRRRRDLIAPSAKVWIDQVKQAERLSVHSTTSVFTGHAKYGDGEHSTAHFSISSDGHLEGVLHLSSTVYSVRTIPTSATHNSSQQSGIRHVLVQEISAVHLSEYQLPRSHQHQYREKRVRRQTPDAVQTCSLAVVADHEFFEKVGHGDIARTVRYMTTAVAIASDVFSSLHPPLQLVVGHLRILKANDSAVGPVSDISSASTLLRQFSQKDWSSFCLAHLFTAKQLFTSVLGLAYRGTTNSTVQSGICSSPVSVKSSGSSHTPTRHFNTGVSTAIVSGNPISLHRHGLAVAQQIAAGLGADWDVEQNPNCSPTSQQGGKYLMHSGALDGRQINNDALSACSIRQITQVLAAKGACLGKSYATNGTCGNYRVDPGETCDCGPQDVCQDKCCEPSTCQLEPSSQCSPFSGPCCTNDCRFLPAKSVCSQNTDCKWNSSCLGNSAVCPKAGNRPDGTVCHSASRTCSHGQCRTSLCETYEARHCWCENAPCSLCCRVGKVCLTMGEWNQQGGLGSPKAEVMNMSAGSPCLDFKGYCSAGGECILSQSREFSNDLLKEVIGLMSKKESDDGWLELIRKNWIWVIAIGAALVMIIVLICIAYVRRRKPSTSISRPSFVFVKNRDSKKNLWKTTMNHDYAIGAMPIQSAPNGYSPYITSSRGMSETHHSQEFSELRFAENHVLRECRPSSTARRSLSTTPTVELGNTGGIFGSAASITETAAIPQSAQTSTVYNAHKAKRLSYANAVEDSMMKQQPVRVRIRQRSVTSFDGTPTPTRSVPEKCEDISHSFGTWAGISRANRQQPAAQRCKSASPAPAGRSLLSSSVSILPTAVEGEVTKTVPSTIQQTEQPCHRWSSLSTRSAEQNALDLYRSIPSIDSSSSSIAGMHHLDNEHMNHLLTLMGTRSRSHNAMTTDADQSEKEFQLRRAVFARRSYGKSRSVHFAPPMYRRDGAHVRQVASNPDLPSSGQETKDFASIFPTGVKPKVVTQPHRAYQSPPDMSWKRHSRQSASHTSLEESLPQMTRQGSVRRSVEV